VSILNKAAAPNDENNGSNNGNGRGPRRPGTPAGSPARKQAAGASGVEKRRSLGLGSFMLLALGAFVFLFPFYYRFIGTLQT
jgi:multiple sugar transport system permease protein